MMQDSGSARPATRVEACTECGTGLPAAEGATRCAACFERYLYALDAGFLESYRRFGARSRLVVAEACLRALVLESPDHRKVLAMTIFEQYVNAMTDLAGLVTAFLERGSAPIVKSFLEFKLDQRSAQAFFEAVHSANDFDLCGALGLPAPALVAESCPHLAEADAYSVSVAIHHLVQDLRRVTSADGAGPLALAEVRKQIAGALISPDAGWLDGAGASLTPDQVVMLALDPGRRVLSVQGLSADEKAMAKVVDAVDTVTRAESNLIYAYLQANGL